MGPLACNNVLDEYRVRELRTQLRPLHHSPSWEREVIQSCDRGSSVRETSDSVAASRACFTAGWLW